MTDLSPEAQAVFDATELDLQFAFDDGACNYANVRRFTAAAALRVAMVQMEARFDAEHLWPYTDFIDAIADELEKHQP